MKWTTPASNDFAVLNENRILEGINNEVSRLAIAITMVTP